MVRRVSRRMRRPRRRRGQNRRARNTRINGRIVRGRADPPCRSLVPWNPLTIQQTKVVEPNSEFTVTTGDIADWIATITGNKTTSGFYVKIRSITVRDMASRAISLAVFSLDDSATSSSGILAQIEDYPGKNTFARCKYMFPFSSSTLPIMCITKGTTKVATAHTGIATDAQYTSKLVMITVSTVWSNGDASGKI